jgi:hypothetical protein
LKRVKADAERQDDIERECPGRFSRELRQIGGEEVEVLEECQEAEIRSEAQDERGLPARTRRRALQPNPGGVIDDGEDEQQGDELVVPGAVKEVAGGQKERLA